MVDAALSLAQLPLGHWLASGRAPDTPWDLTGRWACYEVYECADGRWVTVGALEPKFFARILQLMGLSDYAARQYDPGAQAALRQALAEQFAGRPQSHWLDLLAHQDTCVGPALTLEEAMQHPNLRSRAVLRQVVAADGRVHQVFAALPWLDPGPGEPLSAPDLQR